MSNIFSKKVIYIIIILSLLLNVFLVWKLFSNYQDDHNNIALNKNSVSYAMSDLKNDPKTLLLNKINSSKKTLDIAIYHFDDKDIADALIKAKKRGVKVRVITDEKKASKSDSEDTLEELIDENIKIKVSTSQKMHLKTIIIDKNIILTGSYNFTEQSAKDNQEQIISVSNNKIAHQWSHIFDKLWQYDDYESLN